jgi:hypothetical protein
VADAEERRRVIILPETLPAARPADCPWCAAPGITPIYVHDEDADGNGGCAHYVCVVCSAERGPSGRWHAWTAPVPREEAA